jgi:hypothetical protein
MPRRTLKKSGSSDWGVGMVLAGVGVVLIAALAYAAWYFKTTRVLLDAQNCPVAGPRAIHMIIFDRSDPITRQQAQRIEQLMQRYKGEALFGYRFDLYTFEGDTKNVLEPILRICSPLRFEDANEIIQNPERIKQAYDRDFSAVLDRTIRELLVESTRDNSPIVESLKAAAITSFGPVDKGRIPLRVTLVSDMVQHTALYSHFKSEADFSALARNSAWATLRPDLKGASVDILYLLRPTAKRGGAAIQSRGHQAFWEQLIAGSNGRLLSVEPL